MSAPIVFYSWQSDLPADSNRILIRKATEQALSTVSELPIQESPRLDEATQGQSGTPDISGTIFGKIDTCAVFLADVSFVARIDLETGMKKRLSNSNVLLELGYAAKAIGWDRVILVHEQTLWKPR